jgi:hypothetical protein
MAHRVICRVWYKRWGIPRSFTDIRDFYDAATFAALIVADRIEVVREPLPIEDRNYSPSRFLGQNEPANGIPMVM